VITQAQRTLLNRFPAVARRFDPPRLAQHFVYAVRVLHPMMRGKVRTTLDR
jgi:hypothetical protein